MKKKIFLVIITLLLFVLISSDNAYALVGPEVKNSAMGQCLNTAIGCFPIEPEGIIQWVITFGVSAGAGIAFIMMAIGAFMFMTSQGDPEKIKQGQEYIVSALTGLLLIIFSVFLLSFISKGVLGIPGFN